MRSSYLRPCILHPCTRDKTASTARFASTADKASLSSASSTWSNSAPHQITSHRDWEGCEAGSCRELPSQFREVMDSVFVHWCHWKAISLPGVPVQAGLQQFEHCNESGMVRRSIVSTRKDAYQRFVIDSQMGSTSQFLQIGARRPIPNLPRFLFKEIGQFNGPRCSVVNGHTKTHEYRPITNFPKRVSDFRGHDR